MKKQHKIGAYIRVSTDKQVQVFEGSLDTQKFRMIEFVKNRNKESKGWGDVVDFYIDEALSAGTTSKRPEYQRMMADVASGKINLVLVSDLSRLNRNNFDFQVLLRALEKHGAGYLSMKEQFDTSTAAGRLMVNMVVSMAQFEREQISERVSINCHSRAVRGYVNGGKAILGYDRHTEKSSLLVVNQREAKDVVYIFKSFLEQGSIAKTLTVINEQRIPSKLSQVEVEKGIERENWGHTGLKNMLSNIAYVGLKEVNKKNKNKDQSMLKPWQKYQIVKAAWPGIVPQDLFDEVQRVLKENAVLERRRLESAEYRIFLLSQRLYCSECGERLHGHTAHGRSDTYRHYTHAGKIDDIKCSFKRVRADMIEDLILNHLTKTVSEVGYFNNIEKNLAQAMQLESHELEERSLILRKELTQLDLEISATFRTQSQLGGGADAVLLVAEHLEKLAQAKKLLSSHFAEVEDRKDGAKEVRKVVSGIQERVAEFKRGFGKAAPVVRRRLLRKVLGNLRYSPGRLEIEFNVSEERAENVISINRTRSLEKGQILDVSGPPALPLRAAGSDLSLPFTNLRDGLDGWGSRTRTCE